MLSLARRLVSAPLCAARSLTGGLRSRVGGGSPTHSANRRASPPPAERGGRLAASASAAQSRCWSFGPKISWDRERDGDEINAETMCAAFERSG